ncbi:hypothetical protein L596_023984 [Steinernema carpocapsae]|uniref:Uncharacterized protein n=1 Tax=Steinernema carpocapsae TaxID=34508 RepID=A0A4U5MFB6_STECR|nr:hypothetical protein L596_023984 [Steinernema carpocapsae]
MFKDRHAQTSKGLSTDSLAASRSCESLRSGSSSPQLRRCAQLRSAALQVLVLCSRPLSNRFPAIDRNNGI